MQLDFNQMFSTLKPQQKEAVESIYGPVLLLAGPGSGKTHVLALRIANILKLTDTDPANILALTFTDNAAQNMRNRLLKLIGKSAYRINIGTFHSFCNELIQSYRANFIFARDMRQIDDLERVSILEDIIDELPLELLKKYNAPYLYLSDITRLISTLKKAGFTANKFAEVISEHKKYFDSNAEYSKPKSSELEGKLKRVWQDYQKQIQKNEELFQVYAAYEAKLRAEGLYDFEDMIIFVNRELQDNADFRAEIQEQYQFILVDEYQDTNGSQNELLWNLTAEVESPNIFVVGDDDQSIYSFQGANVRNITDFITRFPDTKIITTVYNFRSRQPILDVAQASIKNNIGRFINQVSEIEGSTTAKLKLDKNLLANGDIKLIPARSLPAKPVTLNVTSTESQEIELLISQIKQLQNENVPLENIAVIYRKHADGIDIVKALQQENIETNSKLGKDALSDPEVKKVLKLLAWLAKPQDSTALLEIMHWSIWGISTVDMYKVFRKYGNSKDELLDVLISKTALIDLEVQNPDLLYSVAERLLGLRQRASEIDMSHLYLEMLAQLQIISKLAENDSYESLIALTRVQKFINHRQQSSQDYNLNAFNQDIKSIKDHNIPISSTALEELPSGVNVLSAHAAKGLEYDYVFIVKCIDGNWGNRRVPQKLSLVSLYGAGNEDKSTSKAESLEEERRLFFVALTRARAQIYISYAHTYYDVYTDRVSNASASQFLLELPQQLIEQNDFSESSDLAISANHLELKNRTADLDDKYTSSYLASLVNTFRLSFSAFEVYKECQTRFLYSYLLKVPKLDEPEFILGSAIHKALERAGRLLQENESLDLGKIIAAAEEYINRKQLPAEDSESLIKEANTILNNYFPQLSYRGKPLAVEFDFAGRVNIEGVPLTGKIDLIEIDELGNISFWDYKTKAPLSRNTILGQTKSNSYAAKYYSQLVFYSLLAKADYKLQKYQQSEAGIVFLKPNNSGKFKQESFVIPELERQSLLDEIKLVYAQIKNLEFAQRCGKPHCEICSIIETES